MRVRYLSTLLASLLLSSSLAGCGGGRSAAPAAAAPAPARSLACGAPIRGADAVLSPGGALLLGDMHGTEEIPRFVGALACQAAASGLAVRVGLEIPEEEQARIDAYLASDGSAAARAALIAGPFWQRSFQDGRSSVAMVKLLESVRVARAAGAAIAIFAFDRGSGKERDQAMAAAILEQRARAPKDFFLLYAGNLHTRIAKGSRADPAYVPMGVHLREGGLTATSLDVRGDGTAWYCTTDDLRTCGAGPIASKSTSSEQFIELAKDEHYDGIFNVGTTTASVPAIAPEGTVASLSLAARADAAYKAKDYQGCAALFTEIWKGAPHPRPTDPYNAACCHALAGDPDSAFRLLDETVALGWNDGAALAADTDLASLHGDPRWAALMKRIDDARAAYRASVNQELLELHDQDQADRQGAYETIDWSQVTPRDQARRARTKAIIAAGGAKVADDYFHAALILQHGDTVADYEEAHRLALKAVEIDPQHQARWLAAATEDRALMSQGKPQKYGTQFRKEGGKWVLYQVDPSVTDAERAQWNCPPLAEARQRAEQMNQH